MSEPIAQPISASTRYCAVFGQPVRHSASPAMQNAGIAVLGLNWRYLACTVEPRYLRDAIQGARSMGFIGLNLTVPHKVLAMNLVDVLDATAQTWGAVNTIRFEAKDSAGAWRPVGEFAEPPAEVRSHGYNTDADGISRSLREDLRLELRGARVLQLGAGGAGRTSALKLAAEGAAVIYLVNRTRNRAEELAREISSGHPATKVVVGYPEGPVDLLLNATSLGLKPSDPLPFAPEEFTLTRAGAVYDMIYRPPETALLRLARKEGRPAANGFGMLLHQGAGALELWSGRPAPIEAMRKALERNLYSEVPAHD